MPGFAEPEPRGRVVASVNPMNTGFTSTHDHDYGRRTLPGGHFSASFPPLGARAGSPDPPGAVSANTEGGRKAFGRRSEGVGDARKVIGRCLPPASRQRKFRAPGDKRPKPTSEGVPKAVGRWAAGTEGGAKAPACDGGANFHRGGNGVINFNRILRDLSSTLAMLAVPPLKVGGPTPQPGEQQAEQLQRLVDAINSALDGLVFVVAHAAVVAAHVVVVAAPAMALLWVLAKVGARPVHRSFRQTRLVAVRIIPPAEGVYEPARWVGAFRMLYAIALPWWKRAIVGQPWLTFELEAMEGQLTARCTFTKDLQALVISALHSALADADIVPTEVTSRVAGVSAARVRLRMWREDIYALSPSRTDSLASAAQALAEAGDGLIQIAIAPDTGWEKRATRRLDQLSGFDARESLVSRLIRLPMDLFYDFWFSYPKSTTPTPPARRHDQPLPTGNKTAQACWRVEVRLCCWARKTKVAIAGLKPIVAAFYAAEGENRLRSEMVWWSPAFDKAVNKRLGPGRSSMVSAPEELALLFHLPLTEVPMESARVRVMPRHRPATGVGSSLSHLDDVLKVPVKISQEDRREHVHILGPTGVGKSTLLLNLALQDIDDAAIGVGVIDPKGDLVRELLERIPPRHADRIVLIDPSIRERPVGLNILECDDPAQRELVTDGVVT